MLKFLLNNGMDITNLDYRAVAYLLKNEINGKNIEYVIDNIIDINKCIEQFPLISIILFNNTEVFEQVINICNKNSRFIDLHIEGPDGTSPISYAISNNNFKITKILLDNYPDIYHYILFDGRKKNEYCPIYKRKIIKYISENNFSYDRKCTDTDNKNALYYVSVQNYDIENIKSLIEDGHNINQKLIFGDCDTGYEVRTIIGLLIENGTTNNRINELLDLGVNPNIRDSDGRNLLHLVFCYNIYDINIIKKIIDKIEDINDIDMEWDTPLMYLSSSNDVETLKLLLNITDIDINATNIGNETPLINNISVNYDESDIDFIKLLLENGADIKHEDNMDKSVLDYVREIKNLNIKNQITTLINQYSYD